MSGVERITIPESGVVFGPFTKENLFHMEKSDVYKELGRGFSTVEFACLDSKKNCLFVEAKSSAPRPDNEDTSDFDKYIDEISIKFQDSYQLFLTSVLKRRKSSDVGQEVLNLRLKSAKIKFVLVIPQHRIEWLAPLNEALKKQLRKISHVWSIDVAVMNEEIARDHHLIA